MKGLTSNCALLAAAGLAVLSAPARAQWPAVPRAASPLSIAPRLEAGLPGPLPLFLATHWWNVDVSSAPVDGGSTGFLDYIDAEGIRPLHPDFGGTLADGVSIYGFPYIVVGASQAKKTVEFVEPSESDGVDHSSETSYPFYPIPDEAIAQPHWVEGGAPGNVDVTGDEDRHVLIVDRDARLLYELYNVYYDGSAWHGYSGAVFDLTSNARRPDGWTSADAAGLAILPGLVRYDEVYRGRGDPPRVSSDGATHQGLRLPGVPQGGTSGSARASDGRAPALEARRDRSRAPIPACRASSAP